MKDKRPLIDKSQLHYGVVVHWVTIISCLIVLVSPIFILIFPKANLLNPNLIFGAIFDGKKPAEIWMSAGVPYAPGDFWKLFWANIFRPDGIATLGIVLGCSVTLWGLFPSVFQFFKRKEYFFAAVSVFVMALIALAMSGLINMAG